MSRIIQCVELFSEPSAVNQSWVCLNGTVSPDSCLFMFQAQYNRPPSGCESGEATITYFLLLCCILANVSCYLSFRHRKVKPEFLFLVGVHNFLNLAMGTYSAVSGTLRLVDKWMFGEMGCVLYFASWAILLTTSIWEMAIISFERKIRVYNFDDHRSKLPHYVAIVALFFVVNSGFWTALVVFLKAAVVLRDVDFDSHRVDVCTMVLPTARRFVVETAYFFLTFLIPVSIGMCNYWFVRKNEPALVLDDDFTKDGGDSVVQPRRLEANLAFAAGLTHALFSLFTLPLHSVAFYIVAYDRYNNRQAQNQLYFAATLFVSIRTIVTPTILAFNRPDGILHR